MVTASAPHDADRSGRPDGAAAARTDELYALYGRTVSALCGALLRNRAEAEDAAQQTFLSAHRALLNGGEPREPAAWLAAIARNECRSRIAQRMREPLSVDGLDARPSGDDTYADAVLRADLAALRRAIDALAPRQREALLLREFGGLSYEELAAALAVSGGAVESLLVRARQRLRTLVRTARASPAGAPWLDVAARIVAGGGAPVAAKVAALGVGAVAVTGGAVVAPQLVDRPHPAPLHHAPEHRRPVHHVSVAQVAPRVATVIQVDRTIAPAKAPAAVRRHRDGAGRSGDGEPTTDRRSGPQPGPSSHDAHETHAPGTSSGSGPGPSGGHDSDSGSSDGDRVDATVVQPGSDDSGSGHSGGGGSSGRDGGGSPLPTTTGSTTVSTTTVSATTDVTTETTTTGDDGRGGGDDGSGGRDGGH